MCVRSIILKLKLNTMLYRNWKIEEEFVKGHYVAQDTIDCDNHIFFCGNNLDDVKSDIDEHLDF
jgi:hypothetical protein